MANNKKNDWCSSDEDDLKPRCKKSKVESDVEEGELSSDDGDEVPLEKLFKNEDERNRVLRLTEKDREEEIFKRSLELINIKSRQKAFKKLSEQKKKQSNQRPINKKRSLAEVFSRCTSGDESVHSSSNESSKDNSVPKKKSKASPQPYGRQKALDNQKRSQNVMLSQLNEIRKQRKEKAEKTKEEALKKPQLDSDSSDSEEKIIDNVDRQSIISSSSSEQIDEIEDQDEDKVVDTLEQLSKIRLSRHKMEKWVHMPFFKDLVKGCFVRVNIGEGPSVQPIYRCAEVTEVVETVKIYDLGTTRTNVGLKLKIGKSVTTFRLIFVSNQDFQLTEFESWRRRVISDGMSLPKLSFIEEKARQIKEYSNFSINDEQTMQKVLLSKQRFQKGPVNFAMRKAELTRLKLAAETDGDIVQANKYQDEIDELNLKAEKLERKRTTGIKNISYINQRNREITQNHVEKAIELEIAENREWEKVGGDPFLREPTKPVLNYRKKKQQLMEKAALEAQEKEEKDVKDDSSALVNNTPVKEDSTTTKFSSFSSSSSSAKLEFTEDSKININKIHNFEVHLEIKEENTNPHITKVISENDQKTFDMENSIMNAINNSLGNINNSSTSSNSNNQSSTNRRVLNLQDYKRRKGLI